MLNSLIMLETILLEPPLSKIYTRLGFKKRTTELPAAQKRQTDLHIREAAGLIALKGSLIVLPILNNNSRRIEMAPDLYFDSTKLASFLDGCREAALMGATAGPDVMEAIQDQTRQGDLTAAVVYDATASEMVDAALDWIMEYLNRQLRREGRYLIPRRFSAGYADFKLDNQKNIYRTLQMEKLGVALTPGFLMVPEKSVTAIGGVKALM